MGLELGVDEVLEIGQTVLGRHGEEALGVGAVPGEVRCHVVGGDGEGEDAALGVPRGHDLDIGAVDEVHFHLELAVAEGLFLPGDDRDLVAQVLRADPVEGQVGEGGLAAPAGGDVEVVDQFLDGLTYLGIAQPVAAHEGRQVGIEAGKGLGAGPFVLQGAEEVDDLADGGGQVPGRAGFHLAGDTVEAFP